MYDKFPTIEYEYLHGQTKLAVDIFKRFRVINLTRGELPFYDEMQLSDTDTPETIAHYVYGDINKHWLILLANDVIDPNKDWLMSEVRYRRYIERKYSGPAIFFKVNSLAYQSGDLDVGATVYAKMSNGNVYESKVLEWNRTLFRLLLDSNFKDNNTTLIDATILNSDQTRTIGEIARIFDYGYQAIHRFEDSDGEVLNSLDYIESYIKDRLLTSITEVTIDEREREINEDKRRVVVIRPEHIRKILHNINREIKRTIKLQKKSGEYGKIVKNRKERDNIITRGTIIT